MAAKDPLVNCMTSGPSNRGHYNMTLMPKDNKLLVSNRASCFLFEIGCFFACISLIAIGHNSTFSRVVFLS